MHPAFVRWLMTTTDAELPETLDELLGRQECQMALADPDLAGAVGWHERQRRQAVEQYRKEFGDQSAPPAEIP